MSDTPKFDQSIPTDIAAHIRAIVSEFWDKEEADYHDNPSPATRSRVCGLWTGG